MKKKNYSKRVAALFVIISMLSVLISNAAMASTCSVWDGVSVTSDWASDYDSDWRVSQTFEINSAADFMAFRNKVLAEKENNPFYAKTVNLNCDIDLNNYNLRYGIGDWTDLSGAWYKKGYFFRGTFNGNGHVIKNITMDQTQPDALLGTSDVNAAVGLFTTDAATINRLGVENLNIVLPTTCTASCYYGGLASISYRSTISKCYVKNVSFSGGWSTSNTVTMGGISGYHRDKPMTNTYIDGCDFSGLTNGLMGYSFIGGLACSGDSNTTFEKCYSANVTKNTSAQGRYDNAVFILNSQNNGSSFTITLNDIYTDNPRHQSEGSLGNTGLMSDALANVAGTLGNAYQDMSRKGMLPILDWEKIKSDSSVAAVSKYSNSSSRGWEVSNPFPIANATLAAGSYFNYLNDGSSSYPSEAYLELNDLSSGVVSFEIAFNADRLMNDLSFRLLDGKETMFGIVSDDAGKLYLEGSSSNTEICNYTANTDILIKATVDLGESIVKAIQVNGVNCSAAEDVQFITRNAVADGFSIKTGVAAQGIVTLRSFYADKGYYVNDNFKNYVSSIPDDWQTTGSVSLHSKNTNTYDTNDVCLAQSSSLTKTFDSVSGNLTFDINVLQPTKGGNFAITLWGGSNKVSEINSDGTYLYSNYTGNVRNKFAEFSANVYNHIRLDVKTGSKTADVYFNNKCIRQNVPFDGTAGFVDKITITTEAGCQNLYVDDIKLYDTITYATDYPTIGTIPEKASGAPLVSMQVCPMWTQGQHYGWDFINQASDKRKPILGFYDDSNTEAADWTIKYMAEHGVDFMNICVYPELPEDTNSVLSPMTDTSVRNSGFVNAYLNSRYNDQIKFAIFLEANGLDDIASNYYDDFFEVVLPQYIEMYFKHPQYQKIDGRPIFGIYSLESFLDVLDTGNTAQGSTREKRIQNGIQRIRNMCISAGVGNPYLVEHQSFKYVSSAAAAGFDAVTAYGYSTSSDFSVQKKTMEDAKTKCAQKSIDFIPAIVPSNDHVAWRTRAGYAYTGEDFEDQLTWAKNTILSGYSPANANGQTIINLGTWDEYGEGHVLAPTEGNGFMYLDALRNVMTTGSTHTDTIPTDEQKSRIGTLYRQDRVVNNVYFGTEDGVSINNKVYYDKVERTIENEIPSTVVKTWDFKNADDVAKVSAARVRNVNGSYGDNDTVASITAQADGIKVTPASLPADSVVVSPTITISNIEDIDIHNVTYIKIRMKKNSSATMGSVSWTSNFYNNTSTGRAVGFDMYDGDSAIFTDYYAPVYESAAWAGKLKSLDITLGRVTDISSDFVVDSVTLLSDESLDTESKVVTEEQTAIIEQGFETVSSELMVPINSVGKILGANSINVFGSEDRYLVKYGKLTSEFTIGSASASVGGVSVNLSVAPYRKSSTVSDTVYVPLQLLNAIFYNIETTYDSTTDTLTALHSASNSSAMIDSVEFDTVGDLIRAQSIELQSNSSDGYVEFTTTTADPQIYPNISQQEARNVRYIEIRLWSDTASQIEVFFKTNNDPAYSGSKRFWAATNQGYNVISIDTSTLATWTDTIEDLRVDPAIASGVKVVVDSVSYVGVERGEVILPTISHAFDPIYTINKRPEITVYGNLKDTSYAGKFVTILLLDKDVALEDAGEGDIKAITQGVVNANGKYDITFNCPSGIDPDDCIVYVRVGKEDISATVTEAFISMNHLVDFAASTAIDGNRVNMDIDIDDEYGFAPSEFTFVPILTFYGVNNEMLSTAVGTEATTFSADIPENTKTIKAFIWESLMMPLPLCDPASLEVTE